MTKKKFEHFCRWCFYRWKTKTRWIAGCPKCGKQYQLGYVHKLRNEIYGIKRHPKAFKKGDEIMGKCIECGQIIDDKYKYCLECIKKIKQTNDNTDTLQELGKINNNLYWLRRAMGFVLEKEYKTKIVWNKTKKDFEIRGMN